MRKDRLVADRRKFLLLSGTAALLPLIGAPPFALAQTPGPMKIGVVGSGRIGGTIGWLAVEGLTGWVPGVSFAAGFFRLAGVSFRCR